MKTSHTFPILLLLLACLTAGCNDEKFFEQQAPPQPPIQTVADLERAVAGAYYALTGSSGNQSNFDAHVVYAAAAGDESRFLTLGGNNTDVRELYDRSNSIDNDILNSAFTPSYGSIASTNTWIQLIRSGALSNLQDAGQLPRMEGELRFLRAYNYWLLAKMFAPPYQPGAANDSRVLPLRLEPVTGLADANAPAGATQEVYEAIVNDLTQARDLLPADTVGIGRANRFAAAALLARVHFQMGSFEAAEEAATFVIEQNGGRYNLSEAPIEAWNKGWEGGGKEVIWSYSMGNTPSRNGLGGSTSNWKVPRRFAMVNYQVASSNNSIPGNGGGGVSARPTDRTLAISNHILTQVGWMNPQDSTPTPAALNDRRFTQLYQYVAGTDPTFTAMPRRQYYINKYYRGPQEANRVGAVPLLRLPEMYLTRAIIRLNRGDASGAAADLDVIRARAWNEQAAGQPYTPLPAGAVTADLIHQERWKEMAFEGDRLHYLQALQLPVPNGDRGPGAIPYNDPSLQWPLPLRERELNPDL